MEDEEWRPWIPHDGMPMVARREDGAVCVTWKVVLPPGYAAAPVWAPPTCPSQPATASPSALAEAAERMAEALSYARQIVAKYAWTQGDNAEYHAEIVRPIDDALAAYEAIKEKVNEH